MSTEPLPQLLAAVEHELARQREEYAVRYGMQLDTAAAVDEHSGTVVITGESLRNWGARTMLESTLTRAHLRWEGRTSGPRIIVHPASTVDAPAVR